MMKIMTRTLAAAAAGLALAACSSSPTAATGTATATAAAAVAPPAKAAAALPILKEAGATSQATYGFDTEGDGNASGQFANGEQVTVYTFATQAGMDAARARNEGFAPASDYKWITGRLFAVEVTGVTGFSRGTTGFPVSPEKIATLTGGKVVTS